MVFRVEILGSVGVLDTLCGEGVVECVWWLISHRSGSCVAKKLDQWHKPPWDEELVRLKRELARVKKERDFLREAATFLAKESS